MADRSRASLLPHRPENSLPTPGSPCLIGSFRQHSGRVRSDRPAGTAGRPIRHDGPVSGSRFPGSAERGRPPRSGTRSRMTGQQRRQQLLQIGRALFAERGFEGTSVEEIAATAGVSKPVVYEHFGGKEGLYAVVVDHEIQALLGVMADALTTQASGRQILEIAALAFLDHIESDADGFRILVRDSPVTKSTGGMATLISDVASQVEYILGAKFAERGFDAQVAPLYAQMLVGMIALTGQYWLDHREPDKAAVAAHVVNLAWNGLSGLETRPGLTGTAQRTAAAQPRPARPALPTRDGTR